MVQQFKISVVVPTFNRRDLLARTLSSLLAQEFCPADYEIVVVVDGSTDGTAQFVRSIKAPCAMNVVEQPNRGQAAARNAGLRAARGEVVLFLDDDIQCGPNLLREHWQSHLEDDAAVVIGMVAPDASLTATLAGCLESDREETLLARMKRQEINFPYDIFVGLNCSISRGLLIAHSGFNEAFRVREDSELGLRLWKAGVHFRNNPHAIIVHAGAKRSVDYANKDLRKFVQSELMLCCHYPEYRARSPIARLFRESVFLRVSTRIASRIKLLRSTVATACKLAERIIRIPAARRLGVMLLRVWTKINFIDYSVEVAGSWRSLERIFDVRCSALMYHNVGSPSAGSDPELTVSVEVFERQMQWLADHGYSPILPDQWLAWRERAVTLPENPILLTFDDGYTGVRENVLPVLRRFGFSATVFMPSGLAGRSSEWDAFRGWTPLGLMPVADLRELVLAGIEIGAHSRTHEDLRTLDSQEIINQVIASGDELERFISRPVTSFCYPYGFVSDAAVAMVRTRYRIAFTCEDGLNHLDTDPILLRRTMVRPRDTMRDFALRARFGRSIIGDVRAWLRERARNLRRRLQTGIRTGIGHFEGTQSL